MDNQQQHDHLIAIQIRVAENAQIKIED